MKNNNDRRRKEDCSNKQSYEKPRLGVVKLFADMVLETCQMPIGAGGSCNGEIISSGA